MEKEVLEVVLKKMDRESGISSIIEVESKPALGKGENYLSTILRTTVRVVLGSGRIAKRSFIIKEILTSGKTGDWLKENNVAKSESLVYSVIHKHMGYLMEEVEDTDETLWCNLVYYDPQTCTIILEDLKPKGYTVVPRQRGMDLEHAVLGLNGLGRYHAMAKVLEERGIICKENYKTHSFLTDLKVIKTFLHGGIMHTAKGIQKCWGPDWEETGKKLMIPFEDFYKKHKTLAEYEETEFRVLNHGDCWSNNMMFKYDFQKRPIAVKFVDYQLPNYSSPCMDVTNFIYFSIQPAIRREHYHVFLKAYHDSLVRSLDKFGFTGKKPTLEEITASMERLQFFGLALFLSEYAGLVSEESTYTDIDKIMETDGAEGFNENILKEPGIKERMGPDIIDFVEKHLKNLRTS